MAHAEIMPEIVYDHNLKDEYLDRTMIMIIPSGCII